MNNKTIRFLNTAVVPLLAYEKKSAAKLQLSSLRSNPFHKTFHPTLPATDQLISLRSQSAMLQTRMPSYVK